MKKRSLQPHTLSPAQRGVVVQRVVVDGWTVAAAAQAAGLPERMVDAWVADFRRAGMASLRQRPGNTVAADYVRRRFARPLFGAARRIAAGLRWLFAPDRPVAPPVRQSRDDRRG